MADFFYCVRNWSAILFEAKRKKDLTQSPLRALTKVKSERNTQKNLLIKN